MKLPLLSQHGGNDSDLRRRTASPSWEAWVETAGLVAAAIAVGALVDRSDPFLLRRGFCWLALAPLLAGLQHGSTRGLGGAALQALALAIAWRSGWTTIQDSAAETVLGWLLVGLAAGEFRDSWLRRLGQLEAFGDHARGRLESLGRAYLALKLSHDRLRRLVPAASGSLREALATFRREVMDRPGDATVEAIGERILALFSDQASVRAATLHRVDRKGRPGPAIARLGAATDADRDPLVCQAARTGLTMSIREGTEGAVLVAVPLIDLSCRAQGVVAVQDMPFLALHDETLELLAVLGGHVGDTLSRMRAPEPRIAEPPRLPEPMPPSGVAAVPAPVKELA